MKARGQPPKKRRYNLSNLRNQPVTGSESVSEGSQACSAGETAEDTANYLRTMPDSMRVDWEAEDAASDGSDIDEELGLDDLDDEVFAEKLERMLAGEDTNDGEWLPPKEQRKLDAKRERPKVYKTGPDVMVKSDRSIRRLGPKFWADDFKNQTSMIETLIREAGHECIFLPKFHCELNPIEMYWGWCKYCYREADKKTFQDAKDVAVKHLNECPVEVIRRFINRSFRFMSAYRLELTGKAAEWAVKKQKQSRVPP